MVSSLPWFPCCHGILVAMVSLLPTGSQLVLRTLLLEFCFFVYLLTVWSVSVGHEYVSSFLYLLTAVIFYLFIYWWISLMHKCKWLGHFPGCPCQTPRFDWTVNTPAHWAHSMTIFLYLVCAHRLLCYALYNLSISIFINLPYFFCHLLQSCYFHGKYSIENLILMCIYFCKKLVWPNGV